VIGERVRDKVAASRRKGLWVGGPVPLGYRSRDKKLVIERLSLGAMPRYFPRNLF
jgi:site-specific DNA recombinase